jgi:hypothetical protein
MSDRRLRVIQRGADGDDGAEVLALLDKTIRVVLPEDVPEWRHQLLALALVDLLGRLCPRIDVVVRQSAPADPLLPPGAASLAERLAEARGYGVEPQPPDPEAAVTVVIGSGAADADLWVDGAGWQSYLGTRPSRLEPHLASTAVGPLVAACRAASQVVQRVLGPTLAQTVHVVEEAYSSALTHTAGADPLIEPELPPASVVEAVLVGAGSIGGAATYLLARTPGLRGRLDIVDDDTLKEHNPDRAILATEQLARAGAVKVEVAREALAHHQGLDAGPHKLRFEEFVASRPRDERLPLVLSAVDSTSSRREIQDAVPLEVVDSACGVDQVSVSGHRTDDGPCIYCLHVGAVLDATRIKYRLIAQATGLAERAVAELHVKDVPLTPQHIRAIEEHRRAQGATLAGGALDGFIGQTLETLYREQFLYGEALVGIAGGGRAAVAAPFVTALAGFLLAAEALKAVAGSAYTPYRLGPTGQIATMYREDPWGSPLNRLLLNPPRWAGYECLCQSPYRLRLLRGRYGL